MVEEVMIIKLLGMVLFNWLSGYLVGIMVIDYKIRNW